MKFLFLSNSIGGLMNFRKELIEQLSSQGHDIHISSPIERSTEYFENLGCQIHPLSMKQRGTNPFSEIKLIKSYVNLLKKLEPDVVLAYTIKPNIYGSIACRKYGIPIIASVTGLGNAIENGGFLQRISIMLLRWGLYKTDHVFFQNQESQDFFSHKGIKLKSQSLIAGSGVNLDKFHTTEYPDVRNGVKFLFIGRMLEQKGLKLYMEAAVKLKKEYPDTEFHIIGIKDDPNLSDLVEQYHRSGIIIFHGEQKDVRPFISIVHCQVHPTFYPEGMSNVLLESAAMGRPAITTDRSGCREIVDDGETGFIIPQRSKEALIDRMREFINLSWEDMKAMGEKARKKVEKEFDRQMVVNEYIKKIEELTEKELL